MAKVFHEGLTDYAGRDAYELVKLYYRRRMETYLDVLRTKMKTDIREVSLEDLRDAYSKIENEFVDTPFRLQKLERYVGTTVDAAEEALRIHRVRGKDLQGLAAKTGEPVPRLELG